MVTVIPPTGQPQQITTAVNPTAMANAQPGSTNYVAGSGDGTLTIIDPADNSTSQLAGFTQPSVLLAAPTGTPAAGTLYLVDGAAIRILDAHGQPIRTITDDHSPTDLAVGPPAHPHQDIVGHAAGADLTAITADTFTVSSIRAGTRPSQLAVAPAGTPTAGTLYTANFVDNTVSVIPPGHTIPVAGTPSTIQIVPTA